MKRLFQTAAVIAAFAASAAAADTRQLAASLGLDPDAAAALSVAEIAQMKYLVETDDEDVSVSDGPGTANAAARAQLAASAGVDPSRDLVDIATAKFNRDARRDDRIAVASEGAGVADAQLAAAFGLAPAASRSATVRDIYLAQSILDAMGE